MQASDSVGSPTVWPAAVCAATSAVFALLGGTFLVGVMTIVMPEMFTFPGEQIPEPTEARDTLLFVLYAASGACFLVGGVALFLAFRKLP